MRGIYSTAIASLLMRNGYILADMSDVLQSRMNRPNALLPPHVTLKTDPDKRDEILILAYPWESGKGIEDLLIHELRYVTVRRGRYGVNTVVDAESLGDCRILMPGGVIALYRGDPCPGKGDIVRVSVVKEKLSPRDNLIVAPGARIVGLYAILTYPGKGVSFSEHIHGDERKIELADLSSRLVDLSSFHIRFRSSSRYAGLDDVSKEIKKLVEEAVRLSSTSPNKPSLVRRGEYISLLTMNQKSKLALDLERDRVTPTILYHHTLKSHSDEASRLVDYAERVLLEFGVDKDKLGVATLNYIAEGLRGRVIGVKHVKPDGEVARLTPGRVESVEKKASKPPVIVLKRTMRSKGLLDGLNVEKRPGDYDVMKADMSSWRIIHEYYTREGSPLGIYVNINTPPEIDAEGIKYVDLYVDIVMKPGEDPKAIDVEELEKAYNEGLVSDALYRKAVEEKDKALKSLKQLLL